MRNLIFLAAWFIGLEAAVFPGKLLADDALSRLDGDVLARIHFAGSTAIAAKPEATQLKDIAALPASQELLQKTLDKLATTPFRVLHGKMATPNQDFFSLLRPLLNDLVSNEFYLELRGPTNEVPELMLAVHLENSRAQAWQDSLARVLAAWTGINVKPISSESYSGWELKKHVNANLVRCLRAGDWLLFGWGQDELKLQPVFLQHIKQRRRPVDYTAGAIFLDATLDWPAFERQHKLSLPAYLPSPLPRMHLTFEMHTNFMRPRLVMQFPAALNLPLTPWQIATNTIKNPMVSFTAVRGIEPWLRSLPAFAALRAPSLPNQFAFWARASVPFETHFAAPMPSASNYLGNIEPQLVHELNDWITGSPYMSSFTYARGEIYMVGMPMLAPYITSFHEPTGDYLTGGFFLPSSNSKSQPLPGELIQEVKSKPNMVCYDWEINEERILQWRSLLHTYLMFKGKNTPETNQPAQKWIEATKGKFGNCATEITLTAPNELSALRNGPLGLTGLEVNLLALWLDAPDFPLGCDYGDAPNPNNFRLRKPPAPKH